MSGMVLGSMIKAEHRLKEYEQQVLMHKRYLRDKAKWERYEEEVAANAKSQK